MYQQEHETQVSVFPQTLADLKKGERSHKFLTVNQETYQDTKFSKDSGGDI